MPRHVLTTHDIYTTIYLLLLIIEFFTLLELIDTFKQGFSLKIYLINNGLKLRNDPSSTRTTGTDRILTVRPRTARPGAAWSQFNSVLSGPGQHWPAFKLI